MLSPEQQFKQFQATKALGEMAIASEYIMIPDYFPELQFLIKVFPIPYTNPEDVIEVPMPGGQVSFTSQLARTWFRGPMAVKETVHGHLKIFLENVARERTIRKRPKFDFTIYQGTKEDHSNSWACKDAIFYGAEPGEADFENRSQLLILQGQVAFHYFPGVK